MPAFGVLRKIFCKIQYYYLNLGRRYDFKQGAVRLRIVELLGFRLDIFEIDSNDDGAERRESLRTPLRMKVKVVHQELGVMMLHTQDVSDNGVYILCDDQSIPPLGDLIDVQIQGLPQEAPIVKARIVRVDMDGMGLEFVSA
jgi:hypothetical protein